ncbi:MAG: hypothetical protein G01um10148_545 [Parcubacteria group bacterium Gr01-1014_8]|nr:MAG: hypothetical protein G01um10148_545 [Parcubacteria group bacterium Gr01-1014_8]
MQYGIIGLIVLAVLGGGFYVFLGSSQDTAMVEKEKMEKDAMMQQEVMEMEKKATMEKEAMEKEVMMKEEAMKKDDSMMEKGDAMMAHGGTYEAYAPEKISWAKDGDVVLFFRASWCPTCRAVDADIRSHLSSIPKDLTILDVNYDNSSALKQKYGVTYQHTFVQVDASGNQITKWSGSPTLAALVSNVK